MQSGALNDFNVYASRILQRNIEYFYAKKKKKYISREF